MEENKEQTYHLEDTDDFGLQQSEYEPIEREEGDVPPSFEEPTYYAEERKEADDDSNQEGIVIAVIIAVLLLVGLGVYLFGFNGTEQVASWFDSEPKELPKLSSTANTEEEPEPAVIYKEPEPEIVEEELLPETTVTPGSYTTVEAITAPSGRSYIIIGSFVDEDLARDLGEKLMQGGAGIRIISPTRRAPLLYRVAVADFDTFSDASAQIEAYKLKYGENAWVLKY